MNCIFAQMAERETLYNFIRKSLPNEGKNSSGSVGMNRKSLSGERINLQIISFENLNKFGFLGNIVF